MAPKGFGSENMSRIAMLRPSDGVEGVKQFILDAVEQAGPNPCPPIVVGVGIGGTFDQCALLAKKALLRDMGSHHPKPFYAELESELLDKINALGIGPQGFGGRSGAHRDPAHPHRRPALRGEHQLPRGPASDGGVVVWQGKSPPP